MLEKDDNLPSMEEISKENARIAHLAEKKSNYFEHPFEFTSLGIPWEHHQEPPQQQRNNTEGSFFFLFCLNIIFYIF